MLQPIKGTSTEAILALYQQSNLVESGQFWLSQC